MSYTNLMRHQNVVDNCQRVSCNRGIGSSLNGRCVISRDIILGCQMEVCDPDLPYMLEPTWIVYLRSGPDGSDLTKFVRRVSFRMSPKLPLRLHVADTAPFEITEVLGSDFPLEVQVQYIDPRMSPTTYVFRPRAVNEGVSGMSEEMHDKMIFVNPSSAMRMSLQAVQPIKFPTGGSRVTAGFSKLVAPAVAESDILAAEGQMLDQETLEGETHMEAEKPQESKELKDAKNPKKLGPEAEEQEEKVGDAPRRLDRPPRHMFSSSLGGL